MKRQAAPESYAHPRASELLPRLTSLVLAMVFSASTNGFTQIDLKSMRDMSTTGFYMLGDAKIESVHSPLVEKINHPAARNLLGLSFNILAETDSTFDGDLALQLLKDSGRYIHFRFKKPVTVKFGSGKPDANFSELWAPLIGWHKFVALVGEDYRAYGVGPSTGFYALTSETRDTAPAPERFSQLPNAFYRLVDETLDVAEVSIPRMADLLKKSDWPDFAQMGINWLRNCHVEGYADDVRKQLMTGDEFVRVRLATPHIIRRGYDGLIGSAVEEIVMPLSGLGPLLVKLDGDYRALSGGSPTLPGSGTIPSSILPSGQGWSQKLDAIAARKVDNSPTPEFDLEKLTLKEYGKERPVLDPLETVKRTLRLLQQSTDVRPFSKPGSAAARLDAFYLDRSRVLHIQFKKPVTVRLRNKAAQNLDGIRVPLQFAGSAESRVFGLTKTSGGQVVTNVWSGWPRSAGVAMKASFGSTGGSSSPSRKRAVRFPEGYPEKKRKALQKLADQNASVSIYSRGPAVYAHYYLGTGPILSPLAEVPELDHLSLSSEPYDQNLRQLPKLKHVRHLSVGGKFLTDQGLQHLSRISQIDKFTLRNARVSESILAIVARLKGMTNISFDECRIDVDEFALQQHLPTGSTLSLTECTIPDSTFVSVFANAKGSSLTIRSMNISDDVIERIPDSRISDLHLFNTGVTDRSLLRLLAKTPYLTGLTLWDNGALSARTTRAITQLRSLSRLTLAGEDVTDRTLAGISLMDLLEFRISNTRVTPAGIAGLGLMSNLQKFRYSAKESDPELIKSIARLESVLNIDLQIDDIKLPDLEPLVKMPKLEGLKVSLGFIPHPKKPKFELADIRELLRKSSAPASFRYNSLSFDARFNR